MYTYERDSLPIKITRFFNVGIYKMGSYTKHNCLPYDYVVPTDVYKILILS